METLEELATEYRRTAAMLAYKLEEHQRKQDLTPEQMATLRGMLEDMRMVQHTLSSYYDLPRQGIVDSSNWLTKKRSCNYKKRASVTILTFLW